ncbi:MAG: hypothetical protein AAB726_01610 [Patescibacteria group bacterium]
MTREEILSLAKKIIDAYDNDPKEAIRLYGDSNNPFISLEWGKFADTDEPLFDLILNIGSLLNGGISLEWVKDIYDTALKN